MPIATGTPVPSTCMQIIYDAMYDAGKIELGGTPNSEDLATNMRRLNKFVNFLQTKGLKLFVQNDFALTAPILQQGVGGQGNPYTFGPSGMISMAKPRRVVEAYYADSNQTRRPLIAMSRNEWDTLSTTTSQGTITSYFVDKQTTTLNVYLWMIPDLIGATGTVHLILDQQIPNFASVTDTMAFPPEWELALEWGLADQLTTGAPQIIIERCAMNADKYLTALEDWDVEDASTSFQPDQRGNFYGKRFG